MSRNAFFSSRSGKAFFFYLDVVVKNKPKCGLSGSVLLSTTSARHNSFPKHFFIFFLHVE